jgi:Ca2+-transporting ATPase
VFVFSIFSFKTSTSELNMTATESKSNLVEAKATDPASKSDTRVVVGKMTEPEFNSHPCFPLSIATLQDLTDNRNKELLEKLGGISGLAGQLKVELSQGLVTNEAQVEGETEAVHAHVEHDLLPEGHEVSSFQARRHAYGTNFLPPSPPPSLLKLMWEALQDRTLLILMVAAILSIGFGLYMKTSGGDPHEWIEGVAIMGTIVFVVVVNAGNDYKKSLQFRFLSAQRGLTSMITVTRRLTLENAPAQTTIPQIHIMVGDIVHLATGDVVPADGVFIEGHNCCVDESSVTGETDAIKKKLDGDVFLISGSKIIDGMCTYLVTSVGPHSLNGRSVMALRSDTNDLTPLQLKLNGLANFIAICGVSAAVVIILVLLTKYLVRTVPTGFSGLSGPEIATSFLSILVTGVTIVVVSVPEGLPMAVTLALGYVLSASNVFSICVLTLIKH